MDISTESLKLETPTHLTRRQQDLLDSKAHGEGEIPEALYPVHPFVLGVVQAYNRVALVLACGHVRTGKGSEEGSRLWMGVPMPCRECAA